MQILKRIKLNNNIYHIIVDLKYKKSQLEFPILCLKNYKDDYWDGGDCTNLIKEIEKNYTQEKAKQYDKNISFMADVLYIYDRIPFIDGIKDTYISKNDNLPYSEGYISKEYIDNYIKEFKIKMNNNNNFKLSNEKTWIL